MSKEIDITEEIDSKDMVENAKLVIGDNSIEVKFKYLEGIKEEDKTLYESCIMESFIENMAEGLKLGLNQVTITRVK